MTVIAIDFGVIENPKPLKETFKLRPSRISRPGAIG
tara:strand:- start:157 stop:264 length:108 start_codon:yes stop_codon:yes gene_type:complete